jgi:hypothetical protein
MRPKTANFVDKPPIDPVEIENCRTSEKKRRFSVTPKRIAKSTLVGIWIIFVVAGVMAWQVTPTLAGFTPPPPEQTQPPPVETKTVDIRGFSSPQMPISGGQLTGPSKIVIAFLLLAVEIVLGLVAISLFMRQSARTTPKE